MTYFALHDLSHNPKLAAALGNMVVTWAHAETMIFCTFGRVANIGLNMAMESYYRIPTFESRVKFVDALLSEWTTTEFDSVAIRTALAKLAKHARVRNHWVHGDWCIHHKTQQVVIFDHRAPLDAQHRRKPVKAEDVDQHCETVRAKAKALGSLVKYQDMDA